MRILQVLPRYAPAWAFGGGVRMFWLLANELAAGGHTILVATSDSLGPAERCDKSVEQFGPGIIVTRYPNRRPRLATALTPLFFRPQGMRAGLEQLARQVDVIHMGESRGIHNLWAAQAAHHAAIPLVWSAYGGLAPATGVRGLYRRLHDLTYTRRVVPQVSRFIAQTSHEETVYRKHGADLRRVRRIPLCVDAESLNGLPQAGLFRRSLALSTDDLLVVCMARLSPVKGIDTLIRAFARIRVQPTAYLAVVGWDHGALKSLTELVAKLGLRERVRFVPPLYGTARFRAYVDADVFALTPRVHEETSLAALEAAACGRPTLVTPECEVPGLAAAGGGMVVDRNDDAIIGGLTHLLGDAGGRRSMGANAREYVRATFSPAQIAAQHEDLFRELRH